MSPVTVAHSRISVHGRFNSKGKDPPVFTLNVVAVRSKDVQWILGLFTSFLWYRFIRCLSVICCTLCRVRFLFSVYRTSTNILRIRLAKVTDSVSKPRYDVRVFVLEIGDAEFGSLPLSNLLQGEVPSYSPIFGLEASEQIFIFLLCTLKLPQLLSACSRPFDLFGPLSVCQLTNLSKHEISSVQESLNNVTIDGGRYSSSGSVPCLSWSCQMGNCL